MTNDKFRWVALALLLLFAAAVLYIFRPAERSLTRVTVLGESEAKVAPDTAVITFSVVTQNPQAVSAQQENARRSEAVGQALRELAGDAKVEIKTEDYLLQPQYSYDVSPPRIKGYEVKNSVTASIDKLDRVGSFIDAATAAGANSVEGVRFIVGDSSPAQGEAVALASQKAMAKAEAAAAAMNGRIVRVVQSTEGGIDPKHVEASRLEDKAYSMANTAMPAKPSTPIQGGPLTIRSQVVLVVDIQR